MKYFILLLFTFASCTAQKKSSNPTSDDGYAGATGSNGTNESVVTPGSGSTFETLSLQTLSSVADESGVDIFFNVDGDVGLIEKIELRRVLGSTPPADCTSGQIIITLSNISAGINIQVTDSNVDVSTTYSYRICIYGKENGTILSTDRMTLSSVHTPAPAVNCFLNPPCSNLSGAASDRTFTESAAFSDAKDTIYVTAGDFNNDNKIDLVFAHDAQNVVENDETPIEVFLNTGSGWSLSANLGPEGNDTQSNGLGAADYNNDGKQDIAMTTWLGNVGDYVYAGDGLGGFSAGTVYDAADQTGKHVYSGDLNADGNMDMVAERDGNVAVYLGNGDMTFSAANNIATSGNTTGIDIYDFDGDSDLDIMRTVFTGPITLFKNNGNGTFAAPVSIGSTGASTQCSAIGDIDEDGKIDIVFTKDTSRTEVAKGNGDGTFAAPTALSADVGGGQYYHACAIADLDGDDHLDIILGIDRLRIIWGDGTLDPAVTSVIWNAPASEGIYDLVVADLNGDGILDIAAAIADGTNKSDLIWYGNAP